MFIELTNKKSGTKFLQNIKLIDCVVEHDGTARLWLRVGATEECVDVKEDYYEVQLRLRRAT